MWKIVCLLVGVSQAKVFDNKIITKVRHGIERSMEYIDNNYERVNVDCLFGIVLSTGICNYLLTKKIYIRFFIDF